MQLKLAKEIYSVDRIRSAIEIYADYAIIRLRQDEGYYICEFSDCVNDEDVTVREFENYLISLHG